MSNRPRYIIRVDTKQYFVGWSGKRPTWSDNIREAQHYATQAEADMVYENLKDAGYAVMVE